MLRRLFLHLPPHTLTAVTLAAVLYLTLVPQPLPDNDIAWWEDTDKVVHGLMMLGLVGAMSLDRLRKTSGQACRCYERRPVRPVLVYVIVTIAIGGAIELLQGATIKVIGREADWRDFAADTIGALLGGVISVGLWPRVARWAREV